MKQSIQLGVKAIAAAAALALAVTIPVRSANAQNTDADPSAGRNVDVLVTQTERLVDALLVADLDDNGTADFDASGDAVAELPLSDFNDLQALPGSDDFSQLLRSTFEVGTGPAASETSLNASCSAMLLSFDAQGNMIDWALAAGAEHGADSTGLLVDLFPQSQTGAHAFTKGNPFLVGDRLILIGDLAGDRSGTSEHGAGWSVTSAGVPLGTGATATTAIDGMVVDDLNVADHAIAGIVEPVGVFPIAASVDVAEQSCETTGWVRFEQGAPLLTNVGIAASGLSVLGALGLLLHARPARAWKTEEKA